MSINYGVRVTKALRTVIFYVFFFQILILYSFEIAIGTRTRQRGKGSRKRERERERGDVAFCAHNTSLRSVLLPHLVSWAIAITNTNERVLFSCFTLSDPLIVYFYFYTENEMKTGFLPPPTCSLFSL